MSERRAASGLVGREQPLERLTGLVANTAGGASATVLVAGQAGIGKTSLVRAAVSGATEFGVRVGWGTCVEGAGTPSAWPWTQALNTFVRDASLGVERARALAGDDVALLAVVATAISRVGSDTSGAAVVLPETPWLMMDAVSRWLDAIASDGPIVVVIDDLQWADESTLALFDFVANAVRPAGVCLVGAYRDDELPSGFQQRISALLTHVDHIQLHGLDLEAVRQLVDNVSGTHLADEIVTTIHQRSAGHPFFARELALVPGNDALPVVIRDAIERRLLLLPATTIAALEVVAVAGNDVSRHTLTEVLHAAAGDVEENIRVAAAAGIVVESPDGHARFVHDLLRETVLAGIASTRRVAVHQSLGAALEQRLGRGGEVAPAELARHFTAAVAADGYERAVRWSLAAASADRDALAFADAAGHLRRLRAAAGEAGIALPDDDLADVLLAEADALARSGSALDARGLLRLAADVASRSDDARRSALVALATAQLGSRFSARRDDVIRELEVALHRLDGADTALEARLTATLARELQHSVAEDRPRAEPLSRRALELGRSSADTEALLASLLARHDVLWTPGTAAERADIAREIVSVAQRVGNDPDPDPDPDPERHAQGLLLLANAELELGSAAYLAALESCLVVLDELGQPRHRYTALTRRAAIVLLRGDLDAADERIEAAADLGTRIREPDTGNVRMSQRLELVRARNIGPELLAFADEALLHWTGAPVHANAVAAGFHARAGDMVGARRHIAAVVDLGTWRADRSYLWSVFVRELSVAAIAVGDLDLCGELFDELAPLADACGVNGAVVAFAGSHAHTAGLLAGALGRAHESAALLAQARRVYERLGAASWLAELDRAAPPAEPVPTIARGAAMAGLRHVGAVWHVSFGAASAVVPNARGLDDLAALISEPGRDLHALALMGARDTTSRPAGTMVDRAALQRYRQRLADIDDDLAGATRDHDEAATIRLDAERESVLAELRRATSTTGQARQFSNHPAERARKAVSARIRAAIANIDAVLPAMAAHLNDTIVTGTTCRYRGDGNVTWDVTR